jgi:hypothetical protein
MAAAYIMAAGCAAGLHLMQSCLANKVVVLVQCSGVAAAVGSMPFDMWDVGFCCAIVIAWGCYQSAGLQL